MVVLDSFDNQQYSYDHGRHSFGETQNSGPRYSGPNETWTRKMVRKISEL